MTDITIRAEQARAIADILRRLPDAQDGTITAAVLRHHANTLDPPTPSLRDEVHRVIFDTEDLDHDECADTVLAVVRRHIEALGNTPQPRHDGNPHSWSAGYSHCRDDVLRLLGDTHG